MKIFSVSEMIETERVADMAGHTYDTMMEIAGLRVAQAIMSRFAIQDKAILVLVGAGNNGGDALVAGRYLHEAGAKVVFYCTKNRPTDDPNLYQVEQLKIPVLWATHDMQFRVLRMRLTAVDIIVDGVFGTGFSRPMSGTIAQFLRQVRAGIAERTKILTTEKLEQNGNYLGLAPLVPTFPTTSVAQPSEMHPYVVAIDCPSGLNCDTGRFDPLTIPADLTISFAGAKQGHLLYPGASICGELLIADIGIDPQYTTEIMAELVTPEAARQLLPQRPLHGHKGTFGRILIAAGSAEYHGAPILSGRGAFRTGAGLVAMALPQVVRQTAVSLLPEAIFPQISAELMLDHTAEQELVPTLDQYKAILLGPGIGQAESFVLSFLAHLIDMDQSHGIVLDADALNVLANRDDWPHLVNENMILTPHPGEMARLMDIPLSELKEMNRIVIAQTQAKRWGCVLILKGAHTVIAAPDGSCQVLPFANPLLGTAGSGDVLAGSIAALLGQGVAPYQAAVLGAYLHAVSYTHLTLPTIA